jgi:hypothetical protein
LESRLQPAEAGTPTLPLLGKHLHMDRLFFHDQAGTDDLLALYNVV